MTKHELSFPAPGAFFSYARFDDSRDNGRVSDLRKRLEAEVRAQTGQSFDIWQDRNSIQWGEQWKERIDHAIDTLTFLIVVVTPSWFNSAACRAEFERFLEVEKKRGRADLILPIVYIDTPVLNEAGQPGDDPVAIELARRQLFHIDDLRNRKWIASNIGRRIEEMGIAIRDALHRRSTDKASPGSSTSIRGVSVEFQHVIQTWGHSDFWPDNREDLQEVHLLRIWLVNNERLAANHVEGSVNIPSGLAWEQITTDRKVIAITNEELVPSAGIFDHARSERKPVLPTRRMVVHEERLLFYPTLMGYGDQVVSWETGADSFEPAHGDIRFRDIPTFDERSS